MSRKRPRRIQRNLSNNDGADDRTRIYVALAVYFSTGVNVYILVQFGFRTAISTTLLICLFLFLTIGGYYYFKKHKISRPGIKAYAFIPGVLNLILLINYFISFDPQRETYRFSRNSEEVTGITEYTLRKQMTSIITLENGAYNSCYGIRTFKSHEDIEGTERVTFTFKTGVLGIKVMTDYDFH